MILTPFAGSFIATVFLSFIWSIITGSTFTIYISLPVYIGLYFVFLYFTILEDKRTGNRSLVRDQLESYKYGNLRKYVEDHKNLELSDETRARLETLLSERLEEVSNLIKQNRLKSAIFNFKYCRELIFERRIETLYPTIRKIVKDINDNLDNLSLS